MFKSTCCSWKGSRFSSQHPHNGSQLFLTPVPVPFSDLQRTRHIHSAHTHLQAKHKRKNWNRFYYISLAVLNSLCRPDWPSIHKGLPVSASQLLGLKILLMCEWLYVKTISYKQHLLVKKLMANEPRQEKYEVGE